MEQKLLDRIDTLEKWKKDIVWRSAIVIFIAVIAGGVFGLKLSGINDSINDTQEKIGTLSGELNDLSELADKASSQAKRALILVGDLEVAVGSSKKASMDAAESSTAAKLSLQEVKDAVDKSIVSSNNAEKSSKQALDSAVETRELLNQIHAAVEQASESAREAKATAKVVEDNTREFDVALDRAVNELTSLFKSATKKSPKQNPKRWGVIKIQITGAYSKVTLKPGISTLRSVNITSTGYNGAVYIPDGYIAQITATGAFNKIYVSKELQGRATLDSTGIGNKLIDLN